MTNSLSQDTMLWIQAFFGNMWKFFAWLTIPGTNLSFAEVIVSMAAIVIIIYLLKMYTGMFSDHRSDRGKYNGKRSED